MLPHSFPIAPRGCVTTYDCFVLTFENHLATLYWPCQIRSSRAASSSWNVGKTTIAPGRARAVARRARSEPCVYSLVAPRTPGRWAAAGAGAGPGAWALPTCRVALKRTRVNREAEYWKSHRRVSRTFMFSGILGTSEALLSIVGRRRIRAARGFRFRLIRCVTSHH